MNGKGGKEGWSWIFVRATNYTIRLCVTLHPKILEGAATVLIAASAFFSQSTPLTFEIFTDRLFSFGRLPGDSTLPHTRRTVFHCSHKE